MSLLSNTFMVNVKKLRDDAIIPTQGSKYAAGYDLYAAIDTPITIKSGETVKIGTGLAFELPEGFFASVFNEQDKIGSFSLENRFNRADGIVKSLLLLDRNAGQKSGRLDILSSLRSCSRCC